MGVTAEVGPLRKWGELSIIQEDLRGKVHASRKSFHSTEEFEHEPD